MLYSGDEVESLFSNIDNGLKRRHKYAELRLNVRKLRKHSHNVGLCEADIQTVVEWITDDRPKVSLMTQLIQCLVPSGVVPVQLVHRLVLFSISAACPLTCKALILRWVLLVYRLVDNVGSLTQLVDVFSFFMQYVTLAPWCCHLLSLLAKPNNVQLHNIKEVQRLRSVLGNQSYIIGLLAVYRTYAPDLVDVSLTSTRKVYFKHPGKAWSDAIAHAQNTQSAFSVGLHKAFAPPPLKRRRLVPPAPMTSSMTSHTPGHSALTKIPAGHVNNFSDLISSISQLELPQQMSALLASSLLQHILVTHPDPSIRNRLTFWIGHRLLQDCINSSKDREADVAAFLDLVLDFQDFIEGCIPSVPLFLEHFLYDWDGELHRPQIVRFLSRLPAHVLVERQLFSNLQRAYLHASTDAQAEISLALGEQVDYMMKIDLPRVIEAERRSSTSQVDHMFVSRDIPLDGAPSALCHWINKKLVTLALIQNPHSLLLQCCSLQIALDLFSEPLYVMNGGLSPYLAVYSSVPVLMETAARFTVRCRELWSRLESDSQHATECVDELNLCLLLCVGALYLPKHVPSQLSISPGRFNLQRNRLIRLITDDVDVPPPRSDSGRQRIDRREYLADCLRQAGYNSMADLFKLVNRGSTKSSGVRDEEEGESDDETSSRS